MNGMGWVLELTHEKNYPQILASLQIVNLCVSECVQPSHPSSVAFYHLTDSRGCKCEHFYFLTRSKMKGLILRSLFFIHLLLLGQTNSTSSPDAECEGCNLKDEQSGPICASNGQIYSNGCEFKKFACQSNRNLTALADESKCNQSSNLQPQQECPKTCLGFQDPVCGSDGKIYPNKCLMEKRNCGRSPKVLATEMKFCIHQSREARKIASGDVCSRECLELYKPVCGSDGQLYLNSCLLRQSNCLRVDEPAVTQVPLSLCTRFARCPVTCLPIPDPICASDGKLYINKCHMVKDNCGKAIVTQMPVDFCRKDEYVL